MLRAGIGIVAVALIASGCHIGSEGDTRHETKTIDLDNAKKVRVEIHMGGGELHVKGGTPKLLEADFAYNVPEWKPVVDYRDTAAGGQLTISQPDNTGNAFGN